MFIVTILGALMLPIGCGSGGIDLSGINLGTIPLLHYYSIWGQVTTEGTGLPGATVTLGGAASLTRTTDASGNYEFSVLANGSYTLTATKAGYTISPASRSVTVNGASVTGQDFAATLIPFFISGQVTTSGTGLSGVTVTLGGAGSSTTTTDANGNYAFSGLANGSYTLTAAKAGFTISPASRSVTVNEASVTGQDFAATWIMVGSVLSVKGGDNHTIALKGDGMVWTWGGNDFGELGNGTNTGRWTPVQVSGLTIVTAIAGGGYHTIALKSDGTVWTWGYNFDGELGDGTNTNRSTPVQVSGLTGVTGVTAIAGGYLHTIALKGDDGTVWTWGGNAYGQLGDGTFTARWTPVQVSGLTGVTAIAGGKRHTIALKGDGTVWTWGYNFDGELGDGTNTDRWTPVKVSGLTGVTAIAGGGCHTIALKDDGTVWTWGGGDGTTTNRWTPVQVSGLADVTAIAGGEAHTIALKSDGTVWTWGLNGNGQLGDGTTTNRWTPVQVSGLTGVTVIAGGRFQTIALKGDSTIWTWGYNAAGQLGDGTTTDRWTRVQALLP